MNEKIHVLYVDDEPDLLIFGKHYLEDTGDFTVTISTTVKDAIRLLQTDSFDLILSDCLMTGGDGISLLQYLKATERSLPFILFTGRGGKEVAIEALNAGADLYLEKGVDPEAKFAELLYSIREILSRKWTGYDQLGSQKRTDEITDFLPDATFAVDNNGVIITWNRAMEEMTGIRKADMIGQGNYAYTIPFFGVRRRELLDLLEDGDQELESDYRVFQRKGTTLMGEILAPALYGGKGAYIQATCSPLLNVHGDRIGAIESVRDISERKKFENTLSEQKAGLRLLCDNLPNGMVFQILLEPDGSRRFTYISEGVEALHGVNSDTVLLDASVLYDQILAEDKTVLMELEEKAIRDLSLFTAETRFCRSENSIRWSLIRCIPRKLDDGSIIWDGFEIDITDRKLAETEHRRRNDEILKNHVEISTAYTDTVLPEEELKDGEERFKTIIDSVQVGIIIIDAESHRILEANTKALEMIGAENKNVIGSLCHRFICPSELGQCPVTIGNRRIESSEGGLLTSNGAVIPVLKTVIQRELDGKEVLIESFIEISDRKRIEKALIKSEVKYRDIFEHANESIVVIQEGKIKLVNPRSRELTGYSEDDILHRNFSEFVHPEDREMVIDQYTNRIHGTDIPSRYSFRLIRKDGSTCWVEISAVMIEWDGIPATLNFLIDITERRLVESALQESEERYRILAEDAEVGIITCDLEGTITYVNPKVLDLLGSKSEKTTRGINLLTFKPLVDAGFTEVLKTILTTGLPTSFEFAYTSIWGKFVYYLGHISPLTRNGNIYGAHIILDDISARKYNEEILSESNQKLRLLTSLTRHDILNQVSAIYLLLSMAIQSSDLTKTHDYILKAQQVSNHIENTIGFTREYENFCDVSGGWQKVRLLIDQVREVYIHAKIGIDNQIPENLEVYADPIIRKVFSTLVENAIRHGEKVTKIAFTFQELNQIAIVSCIDDGIGIAYNEKEKVFAHGYGKNTGLGLFLAREILSITRLEIKECGVPGEGARFEITIPVRKYRLV